MELLRFLTSKIFFKNLIAALLLTFIIVMGLRMYLDSYTHHDEYHLVPDLKKELIEQATETLKDRQMNLVIIDTLEYNPDFPKYAIMEQDPPAGSKVKNGRKIYVKINSDDYPKVLFPNILGKTERQAKNILISSGLKVGKISTRPYFADIVLSAIHQKDTLKPGFKISKNSKIDLIIGDGQTPVDEEMDEEKEKEQPDNQVEKIINDVLGN